MPIMTNELMEKAMSYKNTFVGHSYQYVKTTDLNYLGKIVKCIDIEILHNNLYAKFNDGNAIIAKALSSDMLMISQDVEPMSMLALEHINGLNDKQQVTPKQAATPIITKSTNTIAAIQPSVNNANIFSMFTNDFTNITLTINLKLPSKQLLKQLYSNANDRAAFTKNLANYIYDSITIEDVIKSIYKYLGEKPVTTVSKNIEIITNDEN